jgi:F-type H+-transporting ATPase subunit a
MQSSTFTNSLVAFNPLEQFQIVPLISLNVGAVDISFTNSALAAVGASTFFILLARLVFHTGQGSIVPSRWQSLLEMIYDVVAGVLNDNVGQRGQAFFPFVFSLFAFLLVVNLIGMVPYSFTITSHLIVTLMFSLMVYLGVMTIMIREHGFHALSVFLPAGAPFALYPLLIAIELISNVMRVISLSVRLFANMMAGHTMMKVFAGLIIMMGSAGGLLKVGAVLPLMAVIGLTGLEFLVAALQAYVFSILTCMYLHDALHLH